ncbi:hypothetical protein E3N88_17729 [Mikania micrantha]|uniref:Replication factor A C-terminal domain-containing protein n=1 Tax=Mikania micrantha TaxID=192012 RepID=A0A5N6NUG7_9ASTR|nr:hypothetical protein E3N88_17729 [Mikania micrantha]
MESRQLPKAKIRAMQKLTYKQAHATKSKDTHVLNLSNINENIEVALWEEISTSSNRFNRKVVEESTHPTVITVTAVKVKGFFNTKQLWSAGATHVYLNPRCAETEILIKKYCIQSTISDDNGSINAILFDEAVKYLVGIECTDLVDKETDNDLATILLSVLEIKGKTSKNKRRSHRYGSMYCKQSYPCSNQHRKQSHHHPANTSAKNTSATTTTC